MAENWLIVVCVCVCVEVVSSCRAAAGDRDSDILGVNECMHFSELGLWWKRRYLLFVSV
jgi:hypothetical protein